MYTTKLRNVGNSKGIILPKSIIQLLDLEDVELVIKTDDGKRIIIEKLEVTEEK